MAKGQISENNTTMSFVISKELKEELGVLATKENRSMSNLIVTLIDNYVQLNKQQERLTAYFKLSISKLPFYMMKFHFYWFLNIIFSNNKLIIFPIIRAHVVRPKLLSIISVAKIIIQKQETVKIAGIITSPVIL